MVKLRILNIEDLEFLLEIRNDESTRYQLKDNSIYNIEECKEWFNNLKSPWYIVEVDNIMVGYFRTDGNEIGCDIHPNFRRKGYARAAYKEYLKNNKDVFLDVFEDNHAKKLYEELGFVKIGKTNTLRGRNYIKMKYGEI